MSRRLILFFFLLLIGAPGFTQPPKSYKKQIKQKEKDQNDADDFVRKQVNSAKELKKFQDKLTALDKKKLDAQASGDQYEVDKIEAKMRRVKGDMYYAKDKIEQKIIKKYRKMQDKEVQKRMKKSKKKAKRVNEGKREPFYIRIFKK